ncbi:MAG: XdhC family protein, partial [Porticoccaceae bacterium]|nr:XdhC family protein [Porticoccaceae bacterium]
HRPAYARQADFPLVENIIRQRPESLDHDVDADAAILMTHNLELDANWLKRIQDCQSLRYIGLLGPVDRKLEVMELAGIESSPEIEEFLHGPMGFDIGGDIPESVALSTLAECHQVLFRRRR